MQAAKLGKSYDTGHLNGNYLFVLCRILGQNLDLITKLQECGVLGGNITEFGVVADRLLTAGSGDPPPSETQSYCHTAQHTQVVLCLCNEYPSLLQADNIKGVISQAIPLWNITLALP